MPPLADPVVAVFDANILISACCAVKAGTPFPGEWSTIPSTKELACLACCSLVATLDEATHLSLYGDPDLDQLVLRKLTQPNDPTLADADRGLGWSKSEAEDIYQRLADGVDNRYVELDPSAAEAAARGLDYEDRRVFGLFLAAKGDRAWADPLLVTHDRQFAEVVNAKASMLASGLPEWRAVNAIQFLSVYGAIKAPPSGRRRFQRR